MNTVNRVLIVILLLVAVVLCSVLLVVPVQVLDVVAREAAGWAELLNRFEPYSVEWFVRVSLGVLFALTLDIIFVLLIILEVRRPAAKAIRVEQTAGGEVLIGVASIADRLRYEVDQLSGVLRTKPKVSAKRHGVVVELDVEMAAEIDVPEKAEQVVEVARQVVEERMGLKLASPPKVNLRVVSYPRGPRVPADRPARRKEPSSDRPAVSPEES